MASRTRKAGRKKGSSNRAGFYFLDTTTRRGWYTSEAGKIVRLFDANGNHLKDPKAVAEAQDAVAHHLVESRTGSTPGNVGETMLTADVCRTYLDTIKTKSTKENRQRCLFDFCTGFPGRFGTNGKAPTPQDRIHKGYGDRPVNSLIANDVRLWIEAHPTWNASGGERTAVQALKRAFGFAVEMGLISESPIRGYKVKGSGKRATYFTEEQERAMLLLARDDFALALWVLIRTGCRYGVEFAKLEHRHVFETDKGMIWRFPVGEAKNRKKERVIYVAREIAELTREQMRLNPAGPIFRSYRGQPWTQQALKVRFRNLRKKLRDKGIELDGSACLYSTRHTYAKRMLAGHWTVPCTLDDLCKLMGNSRQICWDHYAQWVEGQEDKTWAFIG